MPFISYAVEEPIRRYKTNEERREAGITHEITDWLNISPLIELESERAEFKPLDAPDYSIRERSKTMQIEVEIEPAEWVNAELSYEYDDQLDEIILDEVIVEFAVDDFKLEAGRFELPFGEYYSRFVTGPSLEFGVTLARAAVFAYEPDDELEASIYIFKSKIEKQPFEEDGLDWGLSLVFIPDEGMEVGISYLSDLAENEDQLLDDSVVYIKRVGGLSAYISKEFEVVDISIELVKTLSNFEELEPEADQPFAWNMELGFITESDFEWAFRLEGSQELEEEPEFRTGLAGTWHPKQYFSLTIEYLHGRFKPGFVEDDNEQQLDSVNQMAAQMVISF